MFCKKCGTQLADDAELCPRCGHQIGAPIEAPAENTEKDDFTDNSDSLDFEDAFGKPDKEALAKPVLVWGILGLIFSAVPMFMLPFGLIPLLFPAIISCSAVLLILGFIFCLVAKGKMKKYKKYYGKPVGKAKVGGKVLATIGIIASLVLFAVTLAMVVIYLASVIFNLSIFGVSFILSLLSSIQSATTQGY